MHQNVILALHPQGNHSLSSPNLLNFLLSLGGETIPDSLDTPVQIMYIAFLPVHLSFKLPDDRDLVGFSDEKQRICFV